MGRFFRSDFVLFPASLGNLGGATVPACIGPALLSIGRPVTVFCPRGMATYGAFLRFACRADPNLDQGSKINIDHAELAPYVGYCEQSDPHGLRSPTRTWLMVIIVSHAQSLLSRGF